MKIKIKGEISYEMEVDIIENPSHDRFDYCEDLDCNICDDNTESFLTLEEAKEYIKESLFEMTQDAILGRSDFEDLIELKIKTLD